MSEDVQPEDYDDPFDYVLALGDAAEAMRVVWDRWKAAATAQQVGMWHPDYGFIEQDRYDRLNSPEYAARNDGPWDNVGFKPVCVVVFGRDAASVQQSPVDPPRRG